MEAENQDICYSPGSIAGAVIGTFLTTILLIAVGALLYRQWRRHKGKFYIFLLMFFFYTFLNTSLHAVSNRPEKFSELEKGLD